jgi:hypothetical protein
MRKVTCAVLAAMALFLGSAIPAHAGGTRVFIGANVWVGPRVWRGHPARWGPRVWWGPRVFWGPPVYWGPWYPYYVAPPVVIQQQPPVSVQPEPQPQQPVYWYYCENPQGYYPYVQNCPNGWTRVVPPTTPPDR